MQSRWETQWKPVRAVGEMGTLLCLSQRRKRGSSLHRTDLGSGHRSSPCLGPKGWGDGDTYDEGTGGI